MAQLAVFEESLSKSYDWLGDIAKALELSNRKAAYAALRATLHALRDQLGTDEVAHFAAQLPTLLRGVFYEGWDPSNGQRRSRDRDEFMASVERELTGHAELADIPGTVAAVLEVIGDRLSPGAVEHVIHQLPKHVRQLWPSGAS
jgi:uncharacterized protein (DUF2267 family)